MTEKTQQGRRLRLTLGVIALGLTATAATAWLTEPAYRAMAPMTLDGMTLPMGLAAAHAERHLLEQLRRIEPGALGAVHPRHAVRLESLLVSAAGPERLRSVSARLHVVVDDPDPKVAEEAVVALRQAYLDADRSADAVADVRPEELDTAEQEARKLAKLLKAEESRLEDFEHENELALTASREDRARVLRTMEQERAAAESRRLSLEGRRNQLDRWLADLRSEYRRVRSDTAVTADAVAVRQMEWAVLRGLYGENYAPAAALGAEIAPLRAELDERLAAAARELEDVRLTLARLERTRTPDDPDVIRAAYEVSLLESRVAELTVDITSGDLVYIEELARERRAIDDAIVDARREVAAMDERLSEHRARSARAPEIQAQHTLLRQQVENLRVDHEAALGRYETLRATHRLARAQSPGELSAAGQPHVYRPTLRDPAIILGAGSAVTLLGALLLVWLPAAPARPASRAKRLAAILNERSHADARAGADAGKPTES